MTIFSASEYFSYLRASLFRGVLMLLGLAMLLAFAAVGCGSADSTDVIYSLEIDGNADVFKIGSGDENAVRLTNSAGVDVFLHGRQTGI